MKKKYFKLCTAVCLTAVLTASSLSGCGIVMPRRGAGESGQHTKKAAESTLDGDYEESAFTQADVNSDTVQWMCSAYAIYTRYNHKALGYIGGLTQEDREYDVPAVKVALEDGWGIRGREDVEETVTDLMQKGHRQTYRELIAQMEKDGILELSEEEAAARYPEEEEGRYEAAYQAYQYFGESGIDGWDYSRALQILGDCYQCGYISLEECLDLSLPIAQQYQSTYADWDEAAMSYLFGYQFWQGAGSGYDTVDVKSRWDIFEELKSMENGPYTVPYDTELTSSWDDVMERKQQEQEEDAEEGYTILRNGELLTVKVRAPEGFEESSYSDEETRVYSKMRTDGTYGSLSLTYRLKENTQETIELEESRIQVSLQVFEDNSEYTDVEISGLEQRQVGDLTVYYYTRSFKYKTLEERNYDAWAAIDGQRLVVCKIEETVGEDDELEYGGDGSVLDLAFSNIKE